jgi:hypothetical protein
VRARVPSAGAGSASTAERLRIAAGRARRPPGMLLQGCLAWWRRADSAARLRAPGPSPDPTGGASPLYRAAAPETLEGPGRGREASVTPPRTPRDFSDGWAARCHVRSIPHKTRTKRALHLMRRGVDSMRGETLKARRGACWEPAPWRALRPSQRRYWRLAGGECGPMLGVSRRRRGVAVTRRRKAHQPPTGLRLGRPVTGMGWPSGAPTHGQHTLRISRGLA